MVHIGTPAHDQPVNNDGYEMSDHTACSAALVILRFYITYMADGCLSLCLSVCLSGSVSLSTAALLNFILDIHYNIVFKISNSTPLSLV